MIIILLLVLPISPILEAQNIHTHGDYFTDALSLKLGYSHHIVKDEFISKEKYSGNSTLFSIDWSKFHGSNTFHLWFEFINSATLENYSISADLTALNLSLVYLYSIGKQSVFNKPLYFLLGPVPEFSLYYRRQNIARGGAAIFDAYSLASLVSLGIHLNLIYPIHQKLQLEAFIQSSFISLGGKFLDPRDDNDSPIKILMFFKGVDLKFDVAGRYRLCKYLSLKVGYGFDLFRIAAWDYLISARDNVYVTISFLL